MNTASDFRHMMSLLQTESFYCIHRFPTTSRHYNPYILQQTTCKNANVDNFFIVNQNGIHHFLDGKMEITTCVRWEEESKMFGKLRQLKFFSNFLKRKAFLNWKNWIRRKKFGDSSQKLNRSLFIVDESLGTNVRNIHEMCRLIEDASLVAPQVQQNCDSAVKFEAAQREQLQVVISGKLMDFHQLIVEQTLVACQTSLQKCGFADNDVPNENRHQGDNPYAGTDHCFEALKKLHHEKLTRYIQLIEYMTCASLYRIMMNTVTKLKDIAEQASYLDMDKTSEERCGMAYILEEMAKLCQDEIVGFPPIVSNKALRPITRPVIKNKRIELIKPGHSSLSHLLDSEEHKRRMMDFKMAIKGRHRQ